MGEADRPPGNEARGPDISDRVFVSALLAVLSLLAGLGVAHFGAAAALLALAAFAALVVIRLGLLGPSAPRFPAPRPTLAWLGELFRFLGEFVAWAAPQVPFVAPFPVFVAVTWPLARESASLAFPGAGLRPRHRQPRPRRHHRRLDGGRGGGDPDRGDPGLGPARRPAGLRPRPGLDRRPAQGSWAAGSVSGAGFGVPKARARTMLSS